MKYELIEEINLTNASQIYSFKKLVKKSFKYKIFLFATARGSITNALVNLRVDEKKPFLNREIFFVSPTTNYRATRKMTQKNFDYQLKQCIQKSEELRAEEEETTIIEGSVFLPTAITSGSQKIQIILQRYD